MSTPRPNPASARPLVSVVIPTRDRPRFLSIALACYGHQTYSERELVVVDSGTTFPSDAEAVARAGGRLIRAPAGTILGAALNLGVAAARGRFCLKMDDDDWYAPGFLESMMAKIIAQRETVCRPTVALLQPILFFDLARWELRRSGPGDTSGGTLLFSRETWEERPFREVICHEDGFFLEDQVELGTSFVGVRSEESYLAVRHGGGTLDRGHTWARRRDGRLVEIVLAEAPLYERPVEALLPDWAVQAYRSLRAAALAAVPVQRG